LKYDNGGNLTWEKRYNGPSNGEDKAMALVLSATGDAYVTGGSESPGFGLDFATLKYDANGNQRWLQRLSGQGNNEDVATGIILDSSENVYVTGRSFENVTGFDFLTVRRRPNDGSPIWFERFNSPENGDDKPAALTLDAQDNLHIAGVIGGDFGVLVYDPPGDLKSDERVDGGANGLDEATGIVLDSEGSMFVTGGSQGTNTGQDILTIMLDQFLVSVSEPDLSNVPESFQLEQNYPNPFNPSTTIQFSIPRNEHVTLKVFNVLGVEVAILLDEELTAGLHKINWKPVALGSGIYLIRLEAGTFKQTQKMILIK